MFIAVSENMEWIGPLVAIRRRDRWEIGNIRERI